MPDGIFTQGRLAREPSVPKSRFPHTMEGEIPKEEITLAELDRDTELEERGGFPQAVCIDAMRVYDSCSDKDCLEDLRVLFPPDRQALVDNATSVRVRDVGVITVYLDLQPIPFHKGFYGVDMTFFFDVALDLYGGPAAGPVTVNGVSAFQKKVILYGSEGEVKMFSSGQDLPGVEESRGLPKATVQVAQPVALSARLCEGPCRGCEPCCPIPAPIAQRYGGDFDAAAGKNGVYVTIGLFTIVQIARNVQMLIPAYDFCVPEKECVTSSDDPCQMFQRIDFPTDQFFPPQAADLPDHGNCRGR